MITTDNQEQAAFLRSLKNYMNEALMETAEPLIQEAMQKVEKKMRERVAAMCISMLESNFDVHTHRNELHILVRGFGGDKNTPYTQGTPT